VSSKLSVVGVGVAPAHDSVIVIQAKSAVVPAHSTFVVGPSMINTVVCGRAVVYGANLSLKSISGYKKAGAHGWAMLKSQKSRVKITDAAKAMPTKQ
jgi:hypothetical protein